MVPANFLKNIWWTMLTRGIVLILFGLVLLIWPKATLSIAALILSAFLVISGISQIIAGIFSYSEKRWNLVWMILLGAIELILGVFGLKYPGLVVVKFIMLVGLYLIINGFYNIISPDESFGPEARNLALVYGILAIIAGLLLLFQPISGGVALFWVLGLYSLIAGPVVIAIAMHLKSVIEGRSSKK